MTASKSVAAKGNRCSVCGQILEGKVTFAAERFWCQNHFTCSRCNITLREDQYNTFDAKAYCPKCFEFMRPKCSKCAQPMLASQQFLKIGKIIFHDACFSCTDCNVKLDPSGFVFEQNRLMCENCAVKRHEKNIGAGSGGSVPVG